MPLFFSNSRSYNLLSFLELPSVQGWASSYPQSTWWCHRQRNRTRCLLEADWTYSKNNALKYIMSQSGCTTMTQCFASCRSQAISRWLSSTVWNDQEATEVEPRSAPTKPALNAAWNLKQQSDTVLRAWSPMWLCYSYDMCLKPLFSPALITAGPLIHSAHQSERLATLSLFLSSTSSFVCWKAELQIGEHLWAE